MIPTTIHSIWIQGIDHYRTNYPERAIEYDKWPIMMPEWDLVFWDENDILALITREYPDLLHVYQRLDTRYAVKSDLARLLILYVNGGLYMDMSYVLHRDIRWILFGDIDFAVVASDINKLDENLFYHYNNAWMASSPFCVVLKSMIDDIPTQKLPTRWNAVNIHKLYGPHFISVRIKRYESEPWVRVLPSSMLNPQYEYPDKVYAPIVMAHSNSHLSYTNKLERGVIYTVYHIRRYSGVYFIATLITSIVIFVIVIVITVSLKKCKKNVH